MSDMGVWRQGELESEMIVLRLFGRERLLTYLEACELVSHLETVVWGARESLSEGYSGLCAELEYGGREPSTTTVDLISLGLAKPKPILKRRQI